MRDFFLHFLKKKARLISIFHSNYRFVSPVRMIFEMIFRFKDKISSH